MLNLSDFFGNQILLGVLFSFLVCQGIKIILLTRGKKKFSTQYFYRDGFMPSSHAATMTGLITGIFLVEGFSNLFIASFIVSLVVLKDALGVRYQSGLHAIYLNKIVKNLKQPSIPTLIEEIGHTFPQVVVGVIIGIVCPIVVHFFFA